MKAFLILASLGAAIAGPALASDPRPSSGAPAASRENKSAAEAKKMRYCVVGTLTGSRIPRRDCRTREEWLAIGYDPTKD